MKNIFKIFIAVFTAALIFNSCSTDDKVIDEVLDGVENGAVLRGDDDTLINDLVLDLPSMFYVDLQEQDVEDGALLESMDVYVTFNENSDIAGDSSPATTTEVFARNVPAADFSVGEFGLPAYTLNMPLSELLSLVNLTSDEQIYVNDTFVVRLVLKLTDGREFSVAETANVVTGGFFNSPFQYVVTVRGGMAISFEEEGTNEVNIVPGAVNDGYSADALIDETQVDFFQTMSIYASYVDNNEDDDTDFSTTEQLVGTYPRSVFVPALDDDGVQLVGETTGNPIIKTSVALDLATISTGVDIMDMTEGDAIELRYVLINEAGREISSLTPPFVQTVPVISCPVGPLADNSLFVGDYELEHLVNGVFDYQTFGEGEVVELFSVVTDAGQNSPGVALGDTQRAFDASYLFDAGSGLNHTYVLEFNCQSVTIADNELTHLFSDQLSLSNNKHYNTILSIKNLLRNQEVFVFLLKK